MTIRSRQQRNFPDDPVESLVANSNQTRDCALCQLKADLSDFSRFSVKEVFWDRCLALRIKWYRTCLIGLIWISRCLCRTIWNLNAGQLLVAPDV